MLLILFEIKLNKIWWKIINVKFHSYKWIEIPFKNNSFNYHIKNIKLKISKDKNNSNFMKNSDIRKFH